VSPYDMRSPTSKRRYLVMRSPARCGATNSWKSLQTHQTIGVRHLDQLTPCSVMMPSPPQGGILTGQVQPHLRMIYHRQGLPMSAARENGGLHLPSFAPTTDIRVMALQHRPDHLSTGSLPPAQVHQVAHTRASWREQHGTQPDAISPLCGWGKWTRMSRSVPAELPCR